MNSDQQSRVFKQDHEIYIFEDNQYIQTGTEEKEFKDATPCFKFNLTQRLRKYFFFIEGLSVNDQPMSPDAMIRSQVHFYNRAVEELVEEANQCFEASYRSHKMQPKTFKNLFLLDGTRVRNLLDIPQDAKVLIASDIDKYIGIEFEDVRLTCLNKQMSLSDMVVEKSTKFSNA